jgi:hypothetical protein
MPKPKVLALVIEDIWICSSTGSGRATTSWPAAGPGDLLDPERPLDLDDPPGRGRFGHHGPEEATT